MKKASSIYPCQDMFVYPSIHFNKKIKITTRFTISLDPTYICKYWLYVEQEKSAEELDENNQKGLQNIVGEFLYYDGAIDPTMSILLNSLIVEQTKPIIET